ncbi:hypothetical protein ACOSQ3_004167 [Xanthoceras sorbifolium]
MLDNNLFDIVGAEVIKGKNKKIMAIANLAKRCLNLNGKKRPPMKEVAMSNIQQNREEVEYIRTEVIEPWDVVSTSTSSTFGATVPSLDVQPLLTM